MHKLFYIKIYGVLFFCIFAFGSCKVFQKTTDPIVEKPIVKEPQKPTYSIVEMDYQWFSSRINALVINTQTQKEIANLVLFMVNRKDSIIYINASKMAIELGRVVLTPDSVKYINHLNKTYFAGNYNILKKILGFPADFYMIQALLMNTDFVDFDKDFFVETNSNQTILTNSNRKHKKHSLSINQKIILNDNDRIIENWIVENSSGDSLKVIYSDFFNVTSVSRTPKIIDMFFLSQNLRLTLTSKEAKLNVPGPTYFKIPSNYSIIEFK